MSLSSHVLVDVNECATGQQQCSQFAQCVNTIGSHSCSCLRGFTGDGKNCSGQYHFEHFKHAAVRPPPTRGLSL